MSISRTFMGFAGTVAVIVAMLSFAPSATASAPTPEQVTPTATQGTSAVSVQSARRCRVPYCYAAIAINLRTGGSGYAYDYATKRGALRHAKQFCAERNGTGCKSVIWRRNGCAAVAWRGQNGRLVEWAARHAFGRKAAIRKAKRAVRGRGTEKVWLSVCSTRR